MRTELVEIYSDAVNAVVLRHPNRRFPGVLIQGDTLQSLTTRVERALESMDPETDDYIELEYVAERLADLRDHYKAVLNEHGIELPFVD